MAAFASYRRSGWVRFLVVLLCALFIFSTLGAPAARAEALTVGLFTAAAVLSAATAALGFKLSNSAEGQATLAKMVQDFKVSATAVGLVLVGSKINGLIDGVDYIKMQVKAGKTYLDERVVAWVQQWVSSQGVYNSVQSSDFVSVSLNDNHSSSFPYYGTESDYFVSDSLDIRDFSFAVLPNLDRFFYPFRYTDSKSGLCVYIPQRSQLWFIPSGTFYFYNNPSANWKFMLRVKGKAYVKKLQSTTEFGSRDWNEHGDYDDVWQDLTTIDTYDPSVVGNFGPLSIVDIGLSGADTIGKDVVDKTLDETLAGLKEWAPDWWDAGADSSTNAAAGAKDLPLNMGSDVKTVTGNPALEVDQPLIYTPWFEQDVGQLRNGETAGTVTNTATSAAETAEKAEAVEGTVEDAQDVVQSIISWGLDYISPDKGLFSRFPLCIPYDAYLLVTAALGVDAQDLGDIVGQSPGDLSAQIDDGVAVQSDFVPVLSVKHDWTQDGVTTPVEVTIDLRPYDAIIKMIRTLVSVYVIAELIASEYKRIRGA